MLISWMLIALSLAMGCIPDDPKRDEDLGEQPDPNLTSTEGLQLDQIVMPSGFKIDVFGRVDNARSLALAPDGTLFISNRSGNKVYALRDTNGDKKADKKYVIASGLKTPNGVAFKDGSLYVAEVSTIWRYDNILSKLDNPPVPVKITDSYPTDNHHGWKYIAFGPDGKLYVPVGAPCNICESNDPIYASITRINPDGTGREIIASGVRNTVGFTWHPTTGELWFTENNRDWMGDDMPPCELNKLTSVGQHFGYPYCHGNDILDDVYGSGKNCNNYVAPVQNLGPHSAPLGIKFVPSGNFPAEYVNKPLIAEHGSWNRSSKIGYRVTMVADESGDSYSTFASGWLDDATQAVWGRPVDLIFMADGSMLLSDDFSGTVYRIWYEG
jgi:glucose/arabinose dehydrogenase